MERNMTLGLICFGCAASVAGLRQYIAWETTAADERTTAPVIEAAPTMRPAGEIAVKATAYCPGACCCGKYADGRTSIGDDASVEDGVAADPRMIPYRTRLRIPGLGIREVDDTGGAMRAASRDGRYHIDIRFVDHDEALRWGVRYLTVEVMRWE